ncbi:MAG: hypothetical protein QM762_08825 [Chryseolinea sp.]
MACLGGEHAWRQFVKGDIVVSLQWLDRPDIDPEGPHPCMVLFPRELRMDGGAYVIPQRNAFAFAERDGSPTAHLMGTAMKAAITMGFFPDRFVMYRVVDAIVECLGDLVQMPSSQPAALDIQRAIQGIELTAKVGGQTVAEGLI